MSAIPPPLRFVGMIVGLWVCGRALLLAPQWSVEPGHAAPVIPAGTPPATTDRMTTSLAASDPDAVAAAAINDPEVPQNYTASPATVLGLAWGGRRSPVTRQFTPAAFARLQPLPPLGRVSMPPAPSRPGSRWSVSAWALVRGGEQSGALAPGGTLGGSQAGVRLLYRLNRDAARPLSLSARLYAPLRSRRGAEASAGLDWRPLASIPLNLLVERRQALGEGGRSAFAATLYGGHSAELADRLRLDLYGQAGMVGLRRRDAFADGSARLSLGLGRIEIGASAWGAAQPGAAGLDAGPHVSVRLPAAGGDLRLQADWRFRLAGDAAPASGPAITLSTDF